MEEVESRCGIVCSACEYRESMHCAGCTKIEKPFLGSCPVKSCCEGKGLAHCGLCPAFPCPTLTGFAYDKDQGDNGKRLAQCCAWCGEMARPHYRTTLVAVTDMARAKAFYAGLLGLTVVEDAGANVTLTGGITLQELASWKVLIASEEVTLRHRAAEFYFEVADMDAFAARAARFGAALHQPPLEHPWGQRVLRLYDPDGNLIEVGEDMRQVVARFLAGGLSVEETAQRMEVPTAFVERYL